MKQEIMEDAMAEITKLLPIGIAENYDLNGYNGSQEGKIVSLLCSMGTMAIHDGKEITSEGKDGGRLHVSVFHLDTKYELISVEYVNKAGYRIEIETPFLGLDIFI